MLVRGSIQYIDPMTFRVMGPHERGRFDTDAWGRLLSLSRDGTLSPLDLEQVIERVLLDVPGRIALEEVEAILECHVLARRLTNPDNESTVH
jgi:hypothetical protein